MKKLFICSLLFGLSTQLYAQYSDIQLGDGNRDLHMSIVHVDYDESGTYIFIKHKTPSPMSDWQKISWNPTINDCIYLRIVGDNSQKKYHLINSFNMPITLDEANQYYAQCTRDGQELNYVLMFEPLPDGVTFDMIEDESSETAFNVYKITPNKDKKTGFMNISDFISETPLSKFWTTLNDGWTIEHVDNANIAINATCNYRNQYGNYYIIEIGFINYSEKNVLIKPENIKAYTYKTKKQELSEVKVLSEAEYMKKVRKSQRWDNALTGIGTVLNQISPNNQTGMSYSATVGATNKASTGSAFATGPNGSSYGVRNSYTSKYGASYTQTYDANAAYWIKQNESQKWKEETQNQYEIRQTLSDEYLKIHTLEPQTSYTARFNIEGKKADYICFIITINGNDYRFYWHYNFK